jgi:DNA repair exonuclease SbcCD ATPase subunit
MNDMKIMLENIGGITKPMNFTLKQGINIIRAPNAVGKSSFIHGLHSIILNENLLRNHTEFLNDFSSYGKVEFNDGNQTIFRTLRPGREGLNVVGDAFHTDGYRASLLCIATPENEFIDTVLKGKPLDSFFEEFSEAKYYQSLIEWCKDSDREVRIELNKNLDVVNRLKSIQTENEKLKVQLENLEKERAKIKPQFDVIKKEQWDKKLEELGKRRERKTALYARIEELKYQAELKEKEIPKLNKETERLEDEISQFNKKHPDIDREIDKLTDKIIELKKLQNQIDDEISTSELHLQHAEQGEGDICTECGRTWSSDQRRDRISKLRREMTDKRKELNSVESQMKDADIEKESLIEDRDRVLLDMNRELKDKYGTLTQYERDIKAWKKELEEKLEDMKDFDEKIKELEKDINPRTRDLMRKFGEVEGEIGKLENYIKIYRQELAGLSESQKTVYILQSKADFLRRSITYLTERIKQLKDEVRYNFNKRIIEVYDILGFKDFEKIEIDDMFRLIVKRKFKDIIKTQELNRLSTSERTAIGIIVMLAGKEVYLPDFPFFVIDEWTNALDSKRFEKFVDYLQKNVPYVIVTALTPTGDLRIEHSL